MRAELKGESPIPSTKKSIIGGLKKTARREISANPNEEIATLKRALAEAHERESATANVLKAIIRSSFELQEVLETLAESAARLCHADRAAINLLRGDVLHYVAGYKAPFRELEPMGRDRSSLAGRVLLEGTPIQVADIQADPEYDIKPIKARQYFRTIAGVPLLRDEVPIGVLILVRHVVNPFTDKQIEVVQTFADQAVIAIENARLLKELRESLDQQTATSNVLETISGSPESLQPVFQAILENATRICEAKFGNLALYEHGVFRDAALHNPPPAFAELRRRDPILRPGPDHPLSQIVQTKEIIHIADASAEAKRFDAAHDHPLVALAETAGARTTLIVPMLKDNDLIGIIAIYRQEVRTFSEKQIELVRNFAKQAVIAIENVRLLNSLRESLSRHR
jgi:GAF domain-containing protein